MKNFVDEFKAFAMKGNVMDLAVAVVIGAAFGKIVSSLVDNLVTPLIGLFLGGVDFTGLRYTVGEAVFTYGAFIQAVIDFLIIAFVVFLVVKAMNRASGLVVDNEEDEEKPAEPPEEITLLREIRDSLRQS
ncbi:large conductance mechanosensitive channel protein MscL [bacterium]|nr:large conductance mechanosensitive channel protein MscL [bacterium]